MPEHDVAPLGEIHIPYNWSYADATARGAASGFIASDVGKLSRQLDDNTIWLLTATTPTWVQIGGPGVPPADHASEHQNGGGDELVVTGLSGVLADPQVAGALVETGGPTVLVMDAVADGQFLKRDGSTVVGAAPGGSIGGSTGAADNQALRADGTGGATVQSSNLTIPDDAASTEVGYLNIPQNSQSTAYTTVMADRGKHILHPAADNNARTFTIPASASVAYPIGTTLTFINEINTVTIAITSDTLTLAGAGTTGSRTLAANGIATAIKITSTKWMISGEGLT
jgi:hypothetical protein